MSTQGELSLMLKEKIEFGKNLITRLKDIKHLDGILKLQRKITQEIEFLKRLEKSNKVKIEQLSCSNLRHLGAMVDCATRNDNIMSVCKVFHINDDYKLTIDVVSNGGKIWTKVIARNPKSLSALSSGKSSYGARTILDQANDYLECAKLYPCMYQSPTVVFEFVSGIEDTLASKLKAKGIVVYGEILPDSKQHEESDSDSEDYEDSEEEGIELRLEGSETILNDVENQADIKILNLDVTAMMAYVSNMTNGHCYYVFKQEVLTQQSQWEAEKPVKPILQELFKGKTLICCETAWNNFEKIVNTLGGPMEKQRTSELKTLLTIYADDYGGEDDYPRKNLKVRGNVRLRSKIIFNFGHRMKALTVSANEGFVRSASQQGVTYAAFIHESRALTESKEDSATTINL